MDGFFRKPDWQSGSRMVAKVYLGDSRADEAPLPGTLTTALATPNLTPKVSMQRERMSYRKGLGVAHGVMLVYLLSVVPRLLNSGVSPFDIVWVTILAYVYTIIIALALVRYSWWDVEFRDHGRLTWRFAVFFFAASAVTMTVVYLVATGVDWNKYR